MSDHEDYGMDIGDEDVVPAQRKAGLVAHCSQYECSRAYASEFSELLLEYESCIRGFVEDDVVEAFCVMLDNPAFFACEHSLAILLDMHTDSHIGCFSTRQLQTLRDAYTRLYPRIASSGSFEARCMLVLEFIIENGEEQDSLQRLKAFADGCAGIIRALLPYGFYYLFNCAESPAVKEECVRALHAFADGEETVVADEARLHLDIIAKKSGEPA